MIIEEKKNIVIESHNFCLTQLPQLWIILGSTFPCFETFLESK